MLLKGFSRGFDGGATPICTSIMSVQALSVSTRKTLTLSMTSSWISLMVLYSDGITKRHASTAKVLQSAAIPTTIWLSLVIPQTWVIKPDNIVL